MRKKKPVLLFTIIFGLILGIGVFIGLSQNTVISLNSKFVPDKSASSGPTPGKTTSKPLSINQSEWSLILVNKDNSLPPHFSPKLESLDNGLLFDKRAIGMLNQMLSDARARGLSPVVCSAYRSVEMQQTLFNNQVNTLMSQGMSKQKAKSEAQKEIALPGASEHHLGLAADIVSFNYQLLDGDQANTPEVKWLIEHCSDYGFILRYPEGKSDITGVIYEPWHFRYVGIEAAKEIMEKGLCLEEYLK